MPPSYADLIASVRKQGKEVSLDEIKKRIEQKTPMTLVDVREKDEFRGGFIPGAMSLPSGFLEIQVEQKLPDKNAPIVLYCAGGTRSALAAKSLQDLGYTKVETANPGFVRWKDLGYPIETPPSLSDAQRERYHRHILLPEVGEAGQAKLLQARVLLLGAGGLGSPAALYLAAAGVGTLGMVDADVVDASNLQRQIVHATSRVGTPKVESAIDTLAGINPEVRVIPHNLRLDASNAIELLADYDVVADGSDNFATRYLVNDACYLLKKTLVTAALLRFEGQLTTLKAHDGAHPCYRCLFREPPPADLIPRCEEAGILGSVAGVMGTLQATEVIKEVLGLGESLAGSLLIYDALAASVRKIRIPKDPACPLCGPQPTISKL